MSNGKLWLCLSCGGQTADPIILQGRRNGWVVATVCRSCHKTNFHSKEANWIVEDEKMRSECPQAPAPLRGIADANANDTNRRKPISHR